MQSAPGPHAGPPFTTDRPSAVTSPRTSRGRTALSWGRACMLRRVGPNACSPATRAARSTSIAVCRVGSALYRLIPGNPREVPHSINYPAQASRGADPCTTIPTKLAVASTLERNTALTSRTYPPYPNPTHIFGNMGRTKTGGVRAGTRAPTSPVCSHAPLAATPAYQTGGRAITTHKTKQS